MMQKRIKIIILVLVILLAVSLFIIFSIQSSRLALSREYASTEQRLTQMNDELGNQLNSALADNRGLQNRLEVIQGDLERISCERDEAQRRYELVSKERQGLLERLASYAQLQSDLESFKDENKLLRKKITIIKKQNLSLESDLNKLKKDNQDLRQRAEEARHIPEAGPSRPEYAKAEESKITQKYNVCSVDLPPIVVSPWGSSAVGLPLSLEGRILNVNTEYNFVVIDLGQGAGVKEGMVFSVLRKDKLLGKIEVIQLRGEIAACDIIRADSPFKIADIVRY
jgi:murein DD-endopeptidase MepM/ murein hydrolase activator NlpD